MAHRQLPLHATRESAPKSVKTPKKTTLSNITSPNELTTSLEIRKKKKKKRSLLDFTRIWWGIVGITVLGVFWGKNQKWGRAMHVTTVLSVNECLIDGVLRLRDFETLEGSIEKIETSVVKLKIVTNFRGVNNTFPLTFVPTKLIPVRRVFFFFFFF
jgi:hypothetical protein